MGGWTFEIPGPPVAKQRPRLNRATNTWYTPNKTKDYEGTVAQYAMASGLRLEKDLTYSLRLELHLSSFRRDLDNILKCIQDGLNRFGKNDGWDDRQICALSVNVFGVQDASEEKAVVTIAPRARVEPPKQKESPRK